MNNKRPGNTFEHKHVISVNHVLHHSSNKQGLEWRNVVAPNVISPMNSTWRFWFKNKIILEANGFICGNWPNPLFRRGNICVQASEYFQWLSIINSWDFWKYTDSFWSKKLQARLCVKRLTTQASNQKLIQFPLSKSHLEWQERRPSSTVISFHIEKKMWCLITP